MAPDLPDMLGATKHVASFCVVEFSLYILEVLNSRSRHLKEVFFPAQGRHRLVSPDPWFERKDSHSLMAFTFSEWRREGKILRPA